MTSATVIPLSIAAWRSTWSDPIPAVTASFRFGALAIRSAVRYAGQNGCEMTISASGSSRSKAESGPSLSDVTIELVATALDEAPEAELAGDAAEQLAGREVDRLGRRGRLAAVVAGDLGDRVTRVLRRVAVDGIVVEDTEDLCHVVATFLR